MEKEVKYRPEEFERREKLELGLDLGEFSFEDSGNKLVEINNSLKEGEKPWRIPNQFDLSHIQSQIHEIWYDQHLSSDEKNKKIADFVKNLGFSYDKKYWNVTVLSDKPNDMCVVKWNPMHGNFTSDSVEKANLIFVR